MFTLSRESEIEIKVTILELVSTFLDNYETHKCTLGLMSPKQVQEELQIGRKTLTEWEKAGLKRYKPPIVDSRKIYYKKTDILQFLGGYYGK